jgi:hypothetical protein
MFTQPLDLGLMYRAHPFFFFFLTTNYRSKLSRAREAVQADIEGKRKPYAIVTALFQLHRVVIWFSSI